MGEVLKFKRPRRRTRPAVPAHPGTILLFTGIWHSREVTRAEAAPKRTGRKKAGRSARSREGSSAASP